MEDHEKQVALRRARTFLTGIGYDVTGVSDEQLGQALSAFIETLRGFGAQVREAATGEAGVRRASISELFKDKPQGTS